MNLDRIIEESIHKVLMQEGLFEDFFNEKKSSKHSSKEQSKDDTDFAEIAKKRQEKKRNKEGKEERRNMVKQATALGQQRGFNVRACAKHFLEIGIFKKMSLDSAQSKLRKKIYNIEAPNGGVYKLTHKEAKALVAYSSQIANGEGEPQ